MATLGMFSFLAAAKYRRGLAKQLVESARLFGECMQTEPSLTSMAQAVPASAYLYWKKAMGEKYPKKTFSNADWVMSCLGLLVHFRMLAEDAGKAKHGLALASVSALSVWKSWEAGEPLEFRKFLHATLRGASIHVGSCPSDAYGWAPRALADAWALAHVMERIDVRTEPQADVPLVFAMDKAMRMPGGLAFYRDTFEPLGGHYRYIDGSANISAQREAADILSESFLYDDPQAETPVQALKTTHSKKPLFSRALLALHAVLAKPGGPRAGKYDPKTAKAGKASRTSRATSDYSPSYSRSDDTTGNIAPMVVAMSLMSDSSAASSGGSSWSSSCSSDSSSSSSSGSSCSSSSGSSCSSSSGSSCGGSC